MSYSVLFTSEAKVEGLTQVTITETSNPTTAEVLEWVEEIETDVLERNLYSRTATDEYVDVAATAISGGAITWNVKQDILSFGGEGIVVTLSKVKKPIILISSLAKNDNSLDEDASWDTLTAGPADGSSYILLTTGMKSLGVLLYFYDNFPLAGPKRLKMTYTYGYNLDTEILDRYCTLGVGIKVLQARRGTSSADGLTEFASGDFGTFVPTQYSTRMKEYREEMKIIEKDHFPGPDLPFVILG